MERGLLWLCLVVEGLDMRIVWIVMFVQEVELRSDPKPKTRNLRQMSHMLNVDAFKTCFNVHSCS